MTPRRNDTRLVTNASQMTYIQSLEQCVYRLQDSSTKLQTTVRKLENSSRDFSRIKKLLVCQRVYELVTEPEIRDAQSSLAVLLEPRVSTLLSKTEEMLQGLVEKENMLQEEVDKREIELDAETKKAQLEFNQNDKIRKYPTQAHQKKQQQNQKNTKKETMELKKMMKRMEKDVKALEKECDQKPTSRKVHASKEGFNTQLYIHYIKEEELKIQKQRVIAERKPSAIKSPKKSSRKKAKNTEIMLEKMEEQIKDLDNLIYTKTIFLNEQQMALSEAQREFEDTPEEGWKVKKYQNQSEFFKRALKQIEMKCCAQDDVISEFEALCGFYLRSLDIDRSEILQDISTYQGLRASGIENMKKLCKFLFPTDNLGNTVARIVEILLDSKDKEIYINELGMEFPPEQSRLHRLQTAITLLNRFEITEIVCDEELKDGQNENKMILRLMVE